MHVNFLQQLNPSIYKEAEKCSYSGNVQRLELKRRTYDQDMWLSKREHINSQPCNPAMVHYTFFYLISYINWDAPIHHSSPCVPWLLLKKKKKTHYNFLHKSAVLMLLVKDSLCSWSQIMWDCCAAGRVELPVKWVSGTVVCIYAQLHHKVA